MAQPNLLERYTRTLLGYRLEKTPAPLAPPPAPDTARMAERLLAAAARCGATNVVLVGLGSGAVAGELAHRLPRGTAVAVAEPDPERVRAQADAGTLGWWDAGQPVAVVSDTSHPALLLLLLQAGMIGKNTLVVANPELSPERKRRLRPLCALLAKAAPVAAPSLPNDPPTIDVGAILSPAEPDLEGFFAQIPRHVRRIVCVWDKEMPRRLSRNARRTDIVRPLDGNFAAQRNAALPAMESPWALFLDADERLTPQSWDRLRCLAAAGFEGILLPRATLYPDEKHAKIGFGLWPDLQLRFFARRPGRAFTGRIHERLQDFEGPAALALDTTILHRQHLDKSPEELAAKLKAFDAASGGSLSHVLSSEYPSFPLRELPGSDAGQGHGLVEWPWPPAPRPGAAP